MRSILFSLALWGSVLFSALAAQAQRLEVPRRHDRPPGPPVSAEEAVKKMTVPEGFSVEIVAAEPDVVNPVAMFIDEKGRFWITESFEYPRKEPGPGKDRIKVLEDTDGDGQVDKVTVFAEGLNIPSGIAVGYGGVWVANAPDILFMQDTDGDLKADKSEVVVTGFGRTDTHELPNSFTWGPDGWLYGLNGVFNHSHVRYAPGNPNYSQDHPGWQFTCAMWRIHPRTREFQVFAEGTSNPWGIAINDEGDFFISACVIDHLWHIVETGYYIRQGGPYPPHTWPIESIVQHKHQKAAYCGITWFDSDAYPEQYRKVLYMGNIHGGCINADIVERDGSTYRGKPHPGFPPKPGAWDNDEYGTIAKIGDPNDPKLADFLTANDPWFMPVVQKTGPDGCLYILDWYDRYHCYQDANADPEGIERARGRLYRVVYNKTGRQPVMDLSQKSDAELIERLGHPNVFYRETAQRLLGERSEPHIARQLERILLDDASDSVARIHALWARSACADDAIDWIQKLLQSEDSLFRAWGVRLAANRFARSPQLLFNVGTLITHRTDHHPRELLQLAIAMGKARDDRSIDVLLGLSAAGDDHLQHIIWQNSRPFLQDDAPRFAELATRILSSQPQSLAAFPLARATEFMVTTATIDGVTITRLINALLHSSLDPAVQRDCLAVLAEAIRSGALRGGRLEEVRRGIGAELVVVRTASNDPRRQPATEILAFFGDAHALADLREVLVNSTRSRMQRVRALQTLIAAGDPELPGNIEAVLDVAARDPQFASGVIEAVGELNDRAVAPALLNCFERLGPELRVRAIEVLTQRPEWSLALLEEIKGQRIDKSLLNLNQLRRVASFKDDQLQKQFKELYGTIREGRNPNREQVYRRMRDFLNGTPGDPFAGEVVFKKVCAQCHKMYGDGADVGPDITRNGRNNWDQLLQNVFDPSAVIGPGYEARVVATLDGRVLTGLVVEESEQRIVLKIQGGKLEAIPRDQIEDYKVSEVSMMPDELEKLITPQELADLFAYLALDRPPSDPEAKILSGAPSQKRR